MTGLIDPDLPLSLYVHVPFCTKKCSYCAFYSVGSKSWDGEILEKYTSLICLQINSLALFLKKPFETVFIGGGNPGVLGYRRLLKILECACRNGHPKECTVELNPEQLTSEISILDPFLTRISIGIQSMDARMLSFLGRNGSVEENRKALGLLSRMDIPFNADIITGVPSFTVDDTLCDIRTVASYGPEHISFYCLSFEEGTPLWEKRSMADDGYETSCLIGGWDMLGGLGYEHYEISNFAKDGAWCLHNLNYWDLGQYAGLGPSAESSFGSRKAISVRYDQDLRSYLEKPVPDIEHLTADETEEEFLMVALRTARGIDKKRFEERFFHPFDSRYHAALEKLDGSLYKDDANSFSLTPRGFLFLDSIVLKLSMCVID